MCERLERRFQFSLRTALVSMGLFCLWCAAVRETEFGLLLDDLLVGGLLGAIGGNGYWVCRNRRMPMNFEGRAVPVGALLGAASLSAMAGATRWHLPVLTQFLLLTTGIVFHIAIGVAVAVIGPKRP